MSVLLIDSDNSFVNKLALEIGKTIEGEVHCRESALQAISLIELLDDFSFIIVKDVIDNQSSAQEVIDYLSKNKSLSSKPSLIVLGSKISPDPDLNLLVLPESTKAKQICHIIEKQESFKLSKQELLAKKKIGYVPIPIKLLTYTSVTPVDIYLKMKKDGKLNMLKRFSKDDPLEQADLEALSSKGIRSFYVTEQDKKSIYLYFDSRIAELNKTFPGEFLSATELENYAFHSLHNIGLSESSLQVASLAAKNIEENLKKNENLKKGLKSLLGKEKLKFKQANSMCIAIIAHFILKDMSWASAKQLETITLASFLHDLKLDNEESKIRDYTDLDSQFYEDSINIKIEKHCQDACQQLESFSFIPSEVLKVIRQHHGSIDGKGFASKLEKHLGQLTYAFITAEEISVRLLTSEREKVNISVILEEISQKYSENTLVDELLTSFQNCLKNQ